jgi:NAD(P)-dependent dehydrogenase (short-subunit alcohol dehydrogenase family)
VNNLTRVIAVEYADRNIRCNAIMPGLMDTPRIYRHKTRFKDDFEAMRAARSRAVPMKRMGDAWDVARTALFLASDEASYITGALIPVDGGLTCAMGVG